MHDWIAESEGRTVALLGAGASQPAVPLARDLGPLVLEYLDNSLGGDLPVHKLWQAISPIARSLDGDVEYLHQAVETLSHQDQDPARHWIDGRFRSLGSYDDSTEGRAEFQRDAGLIVHEIVSAAYGIVRSQSVAAPTRHFEPLLRASVAGIVTLNYDTIIETAAQRLNIAVSTGAPEWDAGPQWRFRHGALPILKLHGSVNWRMSRPITPSTGMPRVAIYEVNDPSAAAPNGRVDASLVFGGGNKLRPDGPWPALYSAFEQILTHADVVVIVGYSFRDPHVDLALERWAAGSATRRIINIDPMPAAAPSIMSTLGGLRHALDPDYESPDGSRGLLHGTGTRRFELIVESVELGLPHVFRA